MTNIHNLGEPGALGQDSKTFEQAADILLVMCQPTRLAVLSLLIERELSITNLIKALGPDNPDLFQHLAVLRKAGLITMRRGKGTYYSCRDSKVSCILDILEDEFGYCWDEDAAKRH